MIVDTHCHYNLEPLYSDWQKHWKKAQKNGVIKSIIVGLNLETSKLALEIAKQEKNLFASVGIHPSEASAIDDLDAKLKNLEQIVNHKKIVAIGEIGLDCFHLKNDSKKLEIIKKQKKLFQAQLKLAKKLDLPQIIHVRDKESPMQPTKNNAYWDTLEILQENHKKTDKPFVLHCVSGPLTYVLQALDLGGYVGFDGNLTYKKTTNLKKILRYTPFNRILVETDAPYLPPQNHRGKVCEPWMIKKTVEFMEREFEIDAQTLSKNTQKIFQI